MDLNKLSTEEALRLGVITRGSWNDEDWETFDFDREEYERVIDFARQKHSESGSVFVTDIRTGTSVPYMTVIENALKILSNEGNIHNYNAWKTAALYNITLKTDCKISDFEKMVGYDVCTNVKVLVIREFESLDTYINRCLTVYEKNEPCRELYKAKTSRSQRQREKMSKATPVLAQGDITQKKHGDVSRHEETNHKAHMLVCVLLSAELAKQRLIRYPFESWEADSPYYQSLQRQLEPFGEEFKKRNWGSACRLTEKLLNQLEDNRTRSLNCNKTAEELFGSLSDEDGEWVTEYLADNEKGNTEHDTK